MCGGAKETTGDGNSPPRKMISSSKFLRGPGRPGGLLSSFRDSLTFEGESQCVPGGRSSQHLMSILDDWRPSIDPCRPLGIPVHLQSQVAAEPVGNAARRRLGWASLGQATDPTRRPCSSQPLPRPGPPTGHGHVRVLRRSSSRPRPGRSLSKSQAPRRTIGRGRRWPFLAVQIDPTPRRSL